LLAAVMLSGCYTADRPLITDDDSVAPYAKVSFVEQGGGDAPEVMTRDGNAYIDHQKDGDRTLRFLPVKDNWYVAEMSGVDPDDKSVQRLYGLVHVDVAKKIAEAYETGGDGTDVGPGLRACEAGICIDDLAAYIAHAEAKVTAGAKPDTVFDISVE
jgi:hypothetical protein